MDDPFAGLPPWNPGKYNPLETPPPEATIDKVMAAANEARATLNEEQREHFDQVMSLLSALGFGATLALKEEMAGGNTASMNVGEIMGLSDEAIIAFIRFAATLANVGIDAIVPRDDPHYKSVGDGQIQVLMGLLVGYKLRQEQEGRRR